MEVFFFNHHMLTANKGVYKKSRPLKFKLSAIKLLYVLIWQLWMLRINNAPKP